MRTGPIVIPTTGEAPVDVMAAAGATVPLVLPAWAIDKSIPAPMPAHYTRGSDKTAIELAREDGYKTTLTYPSRPEKPAILRKRIEEVTDAELTAVPQARAGHVAAIEAYERAKYAYHQDEARLTALLRTDLEVEHEMVDHPKADKLWGKAWEDGHHAGLSEVAQVYENLVELAK